MKDTFSRYHPIVNFLYFTFVGIFSMFFMHPVCLLISLVCSFTYSVELGGRRRVLTNLKFLLPTIIGMGIMNPAFNHEGVTIITYLRSGNPLTLESIVYGIGAAMMICSMILWFYCYNQVMTSDKFIYLFGKIIPALSLVLSMALRFVPKFKSQIEIVSNSQRAIGRDVSNGKLIDRMKNGITILSIMITWSLENAIETSDSMRSRGYGLNGRTSFSIYKFENRDKLAIIAIVILSSFIVLGGKVFGGFKWRYFPSMKGSNINILSISLWIAYFILCILPIMINRQEDRQWKSTQLEI